ncbi:MAG: hypothetical protein M3O86_01865 [Actinomycetota bacterium]|nr:hypothetical protein [Actinomycetota bacterium]
MVLAYGVERATRDVDALFEPHGVVSEEARAVGAELGLPPWWLNDQASAYLARVADDGASPVFDHPNLRVHACSARHLLAMKALAARPHDLADLRVLVAHLGLRSATEVFDVVAAVFPDEAISGRKRLLVEDLFA